MKQRLAPRMPLPALKNFNETPAQEAGGVEKRDIPPVALTPNVDASAAPDDSLFDREVSLALIDVSPYQPRLVFDEEEIKLLADSISDGGLINAITVREKTGGRFEIISGERRFRAHKLLGMPSIKVSIRKLGDKEASLEALTDNEARKDLCDYERGKSFRRILDSKFVDSQAQLSRKIGVPTATISRCLSFFKLPGEALDLLDKRPTLLGGTNAEVLSMFAAEGHGSVVVKAIHLIHDKGINELAAINFAKAEIRKAKGGQVEIKQRPLILNGRHMGDIHVDGRKVVISCPKDVNPEEVITQIKALLGAS